MRSIIKKEKHSPFTVRVLSQSEPTDALSGAEDDVSEPSRRRASASSRRHYRRSLSFSLARPLRWGATRSGYRSHRYRLFLCFVALRSFGYVSETSSARRHTVGAPTVASLPATAVNALDKGDTPKVLRQKEGTCCHAPSGFINQPNYPLRLPA